MGAEDKPNNDDAELLAALNNQNGSDKSTVNQNDKTVNQVPATVSQQQSAETGTQAGAGAPATPSAPRNYSKIWGDSVIVRPGSEAANSNNAEPGLVSPNSEPTATKVSKQAIDAGARTAVAMLNLTQTTLMRPVLNWRFRKEAEKRFGEETYREGMDMIMGDIKPKNDTEKRIKGSVSAFLEQRDQKLIAIPFTPTEEKDLEYAFREYFALKNQAMTPEVLLYCSLGGTVGKRFIDALLWD